MEQVRCSTTPQIEQSIQILHTAFLTKNTRRRKHDSSPRTSANDRFHAQRSTKKAQMAHNTTLRWQLSPTPQAYRSFRKNRHWAIGNQAFKALTFILGVGNNNRCDRSTIAQSEQYMRRRSSTKRRATKTSSPCFKSLPSMPRSCDGTIVKTTMTCHLSNLLTGGPHVPRSILTITCGARPFGPSARILTLQSVVKRSKHQLGTTLQSE